MIYLDNREDNQKKIKNSNPPLSSKKLFPDYNEMTTAKNEFDLKLPYKSETSNKRHRCYNSNEINAEREINYEGDKIYEPPEEKLNELCEVFDILYSSGDETRNQEYEEIKKLRSLCITLEQSNNDLEFVTKRLDHENKCFEPRINQLKEINRKLLEDNAEYLGRSIENKILSKDVEKLKELLDALTVALNEEVNNHCRLQEEYLATEFNRKQFEKDRMVYELTSVATNHQLNNLSSKKAYLENCKEDLIKKQVYINRLQDIKGMFRVVVRVRAGPNKNRNSIFSYSADDKITIKSLKVVNKPRNETKMYQFNKVLRPESSNINLFNCLESSINQLINGYNVCFIHFGTSGSGKSLSAIGDIPDEFGTSTLLVGKLIDEMNKEHRKRFKIEVSFLEFYNESISCLLGGQKIKFQDTGQKILVDNYNKEKITALNSFNRLLKQAALKRQTSATSYCFQSSRSHMVILVSINSENTITFGKIKSKLIICDLAGYEKSNSDFQHVSKQHVDETFHINNSLSALSQVIEELHQYKIKSHKKQSTLPFRSSKLTQFLKPCFCGDAYCYLILHICDDPAQMQSNYKTLNFGQLAMSTELGKPICHKIKSEVSCIAKCNV